VQPRAHLLRSFSDTKTRCRCVTHAPDARKSAAKQGEAIRVVVVAPLPTPDPPSTPPCQCLNALPHPFPRQRPPLSRVPQKATAPKKVKATVYTIDVSKVAADNVLDPQDLGKYLTEQIKVNNKKGNLGSAVTVTVDRNIVKVTVKDSTPLPKRYLKYLSKKYLTKNEVKEYVRIVACSKGGYDLRYRSAKKAEEDEE
jgi:large subunit ribosomal protein L22e